MGVHKNIESPELLWDLFTQYVKHEAENPMYKIEYVGREGNKETTPLPVPIIWEGFECWMADNNYMQDMKDYASNKEERYTDFAPVVTRIRNNCFANNFKGAAVGLFSANLIARKLGLVEKQQQEVVSELKVTIQGGEVPQDIKDQYEG